MKRKSDEPTAGPFVTKLDPSLTEKLRAGLLEQGFELSTPAYTVFSGKKPGVSCTLYNSGKLTVQGKDAHHFIEFYLEPEILQTCSYTYQDLDIDPRPRIGIDESGKGDLFGPLCIAGVFAEGDKVLKLETLGVKDSKLLSDPAILKIGKKIRAEYAHHVVRINPPKYNELYEQFRNLNTMLAWGHATTIEHLVLQTNCRDVIIDQFAAEHVVITALRRKKLEVNLTQRHKGEEDLVVAAASILARCAFLEGLEKMGETFGLEFPKGVSEKVIQVLKQYVQKFGRQQLNQVVKMHFKTLEKL